MEKKRKSGIALIIAGAVMAAIAIAAIVLAVVGATAGFKAAAEVAEIKRGHVYRYALDDFVRMGETSYSFVSMPNYAINVNNNANPEYTDVAAFEYVATGTQNAGYLKRTYPGAYMTDAMTSGAYIYDNAPSSATYYNVVYRHADGTTTTIGRSTTGWYVDVYFDTTPTFTGTYAQQVGAYWVQYATDLGALSDAPEIDTTATATFIIPPASEFSEIGLTAYKISNAAEYASQNGTVNLSVTLKDQTDDITAAYIAELSRVGEDYYFIPIVNELYQHITDWGTGSSTAPTIDSQYYNPAKIELKFLTGHDTVEISNGAIFTSWQLNTLLYAYHLKDLRQTGYNDGLTAGEELARSEYETALGVYASMDIVSGIFAKIGEILNIPLFGSIPLYVFVLIPLIMGVIYVILKFVR